MENEIIRHNSNARYRHEVLFQKPNSDNTILYYEYKTKKWIRIRAIERLPYNLMIYETEPINNQIYEIVTCPDSICFDENINHEEELKWRKNIKSGDELDFFDKDKNIWIKAQVDGIKEDIVPGVLRLSIRKKPNLIIGYYFYESKIITKSCTYTKKFTEEELQLENEREEKFKYEYEESQQKIRNILSRLKTLKTPKHYLGMYSEKIKDILPLYLNEWKFADSVTENEVKKLNFNFVNNNSNPCLINLIKIQEDGYEGEVYDGVIFDYYNIIEKNYISLGNGYDGYYDIYLKAYEDGINIQDILKDDVYLNINSIKIKGVIDKEKNIIKFPDFKKDNPLITLGFKYYISSKSFENGIKIKCYYTSFYLSCIIRLMIAKNIFIPTRYTNNSKNFIIFHSLGATIEVPENEIDFI